MRGSNRLRPADLVSESVAGILQRPGRTAMTVVGILLGIGSFVAVLGLTATATGQISKRFTELAATEVTVEDTTALDPNTTGTAFPADADARARAVNGVNHAGVYWQLPSRTVGAVTGVRIPGASTSDQIPVIAASPGLFDALRAHVSAGRTYDQALDARAERVVVLGGFVARQLGITRLDVRPVIYINDAPFTVIGIIDTVQRRPDFLADVLVPRHTAETLWPGAIEQRSPPTMVIDTRLGAAGVVAQQAALAVRPDRPGAFRTITPPDPRQLRDDVGTDLSSLFLTLAAISLAIGAVGIANTTLVAVLERVPEIGLRRALGAQRRHIAAQFLCESTTLGAIGGLVAAGLGVTVVVAVAVTRQWTPVLEPWTVAAAPVVGALTGLLAGLYPSIRASRIQPAEALRQ
ncbi:ABC transporter permease [Longispora urticae]